MKLLKLITLLLLLTSCHQANNKLKMPIQLTNNAVASVQSQDGVEFYTFNGLLKGKTWKDITNTGYKFQGDTWIKLALPEQALPVLASTAVSIGNKIYVIGGYTVNAKGEEKSVPYIFELDTIQQTWMNKTTMPIPVDDTVALTYKNRYIYLISGWHDTDNVSNVQVYDTQDDRWFPATQYPAPAVFGHAGGIVDNVMLICDGVKVVPNEKSRDFIASAVCVKGTIDSVNPNIIDWVEIPHHSNIAFYRMAAIGDLQNNRVVFAGGSDNPYNYNGIGYDGEPSQASNLVFTYDFSKNTWKGYEGIIKNTMDHRALLSDGEWFYILGGMDSMQHVTDGIIKFRVPNE